MPYPSFLEQTFLEVLLLKSNSYEVEVGRWAPLEAGSQVEVEIESELVSQKPFAVLEVQGNLQDLHKRMPW